MVTGACRADASVRSEEARAVAQPVNRERPSRSSAESTAGSAGPRDSDRVRNVQPPPRGPRQDAIAEKGGFFRAPRWAGINAPRSRSVWQNAGLLVVPRLCSNKKRRRQRGQVRGMKAPDIRRSAGDAPRVSSRVALFAAAMSFSRIALRQSLSGGRAPGAYGQSYDFWAVAQSRGGGRWSPCRACSCRARR